MSQIEREVVIFKPPDLHYFDFCGYVGEKYIGPLTDDGIKVRMFFYQPILDSYRHYVSLTFESDEDAILFRLKYLDK